MKKPESVVHALTFGVPDDWRTKIQELMIKSQQFNESEQVIVVNGAMHAKLCAAITPQDYPTVNKFGMPAPLTINFLCGAVDVHVIGPLQYSLYKGKDPDNTVLLMSKDAWEFMRGSGPLWDKAKKGVLTR